MKLRELLIEHLEDIGHNRVPLREESGKFWGVCFQLDSFLEEVLGEFLYDMEEWICTESEYFLFWKTFHRRNYVSFFDINSFEWIPRRALCLGLADEIKSKPNLFSNEVDLPLTEDKEIRYIFKDLNITFDKTKGAFLKSQEETQ